MNITLRITHLFLLCLITISYCYCQTDTLIEKQEFKFIKYGISVYPKNYTGLETLMTDLESSRDTMFGEMTEAFNHLKQRRQSGKILGYTGIGVGLAVMLGTAVSTKENDRFESNNATGYVAGVIVMGAGALIYHLLNTREKDIQRFVEEFNRKSADDRKLEFALQTNFTQRFDGVGLAIKYRFN